MKYQIGEPGRIVVARFNDGDDVLAELQKIAQDENIRAASFHLVGGIKRGRFVVGPEREEMPPVPMWRELSESHELVGFGTIFWQGEVPKIHFHGVYGKRDNVKTGCLREAAQVFLVLEAVIMELKGVDARREYDPASGMVLLSM